MERMIAGLVLCAGVVFASSCSRPAEPGAGDASPSTTAPVATVATSGSAAIPASATPAVDSDEPLAWLAGAWCGKDENQDIEETWLAPHESEMIGMSRTLAGGRMISFEFMRIMDLEGTVTLIAQPGGDAPTNFKRTDGGADWIRFENKQHDYPQRIEYRRTGEGLHAEIGGPGAGDKEAVISYDYARCGK